MAKFAGKKVCLNNIYVACMTQTRRITDAWTWLVDQSYFITIWLVGPIEAQQMDVLIVAAMFSEGILDNNDIYTIQETKQHDHILNIQLSWRDVPAKQQAKVKDQK